VPAPADPGRSVHLGRGAKIGIAVAVPAIAVAAVTAALAAPGSSAPHPHKAADVHRNDNTLPLLASGSDSATAQRPAAPIALTKIRHGKPAPATHAVISGLAANGIPKVALNAYRVAAARMADAEPSCGIQWWLLAGIGREESDHGRFGGAVLQPNGVSVPKIIGPPLNGHGTAYIPAPPDGAALDGDAVYTRALGPMQFIPQTWASYGTDGNGDGVADIFNINDAALSAARYLCAAGGNLRTAAGQRAAILAYNHSTVYLAQVLALANAYRTGVPVTGVPVGPTSGPLPPVVLTGPLPPVNPGPPTAVSGSKHRQGSNSSGARGGTKQGAGGSSRGTGSGSGTRSGTGRTSGTGSGGQLTAPTTSAAPSKLPVPAPSSSSAPVPLPSVSVPLPTAAKSSTGTATPSPSTSCTIDALGVKVCVKI
jgi:membrane-bound lytic murein transglycosylase B